MKIYLLDTNIISYAAGDNPAIQSRIEKLAATAHVCISAITEAELRFGLAKKPPSRARQLAVEGYIARFHVLPWIPDLAKVYAKLRVANETLGKTIDGFDLLIAAQAVAEGAVLVTNDARLAEMKGVEVERWQQ